MAPGLSSRSRLAPRPAASANSTGSFISVLDEQQVYRIDHFLGKEATQDLHVLRFANSSSAAYWDREHVESVQIDVPETLGISDRAQFYDATGAVLDMLVTHLFQVAAEVAWNRRPAWTRRACRRPGTRS